MLVTNKYLIVSVMDEFSLSLAKAEGISAILVGIPESLQAQAESEGWKLPHLWVEEIFVPIMEPADVT